VLEFVEFLKQKEKKSEEFMKVFDDWSDELKKYLLEVLMI